MKKNVLFWLVGIAIIGTAVVIFHRQETRTISPDSSVPSLRASIESAIQYHGAQKAYQEFLDAFFGIDFNTQHNGMHIFGESLYKQLGVRGVQYCGADFAFGCYHGFFNQAVSSEGLSIVEMLDASCEDAEDSRASACRHGIGHGILEYLGSTHLAEALDTCLRTTQPDPVAGCTSGVFMEYNVPLEYTEDGYYNSNPRALTENPFAPCDTIDTKFRFSCYYELPQWWLQVYKKDYAILGKLCAQLEKQYQTQCFLGVGKIAGPSASYDSTATREYCEQMPDTNSSYLCRTAAAWSIVYDGGGFEESSKVCSVIDSRPEYPCPIMSKQTP